MISPQERPAHEPGGFQMIRSIEINNFRCFKRLKLERVARLNVVVGDNGSGKTALLEAVFFVLATTTQLAMRFRQQRGIDPHFNAAKRRIEDAIWGDLFHNFNYQEPVILASVGDGPETRSLTIVRGEWPKVPSSVGLIYKNAAGQEQMLHPQFDINGMPVFPETGEDLPMFFYFNANATPGSIETAGRFSDISRARAEAPFVKTFVDEYKWLENLNVEVQAGAPILYGTQKGVQDKISLPNISGGINRMVAVMAAIASRNQAVVLVDEIENGVYYKHQTAIWKGMLHFLRTHKAQLICTTHSKEWLQALVDAAGDRIDDIAIWRVEREKPQPTVRQFTGQAIRAGLEMGTEPR